MDTLIAIYPTLKSLWVVLFFVLFIWVVLRVMRPSKRRDYETMGQIPLRDDPPGDGPPGEGRPGNGRQER